MTQSQTHFVDGEFQIDEDVPFQHRMWVIQRVAWVVMALVILAALLGLFGAGSLSSAVAGEKGGPLWVEHHRFARLLSPEEVRIHWGPNIAGPDGKVRIQISREYLQGHQVQHVVPQPESVEVGEDRLVYTFNVQDNAQPGAATFSLSMNQIGRTDVEVGVQGGPSVKFWQFVYP